MVSNIIKDLKGKKVKIRVAFGGSNPGSSMEKTGKVTGICYTGYNYFIKFEDGTIINARYIQIIEPIE